MSPRSFSISTLALLRFSVYLKAGAVRFNGGIFGQICQIFFVYVISVVHKWQLGRNIWFYEGSATYWALNSIPYYLTPIGRLFAGFPRTVLKYFTWVVLCTPLPTFLHFSCPNSTIFALSLSLFLVCVCVKNVEDLRSAVSTWMGSDRMVRSLHPLEKSYPFSLFGASAVSAPVLMPVIDCEDYWRMLAVLGFVCLHGTTA